MRSVVAIFLPSKIEAAARRSSILPLVQEPKKTVSIAIFLSGVPATSPMYCRARSASTSNRNFEGRQGKGGRTHLVSPLVAAATAIRGTLSSPADL